MRKALVLLAALAPCIAGAGELEPLPPPQVAPQTDLAPDTAWPKEERLRLPYAHLTPQVDNLICEPVRTTPQRVRIVEEDPAPVVEERHHYRRHWRRHWRRRWR